YVYDVYFFVQAEDGIRDFHVTGVQTCALPISRVLTLEGPLAEQLLAMEDLSDEYGDLMALIHYIEKDKFWSAQISGLALDRQGRSEERRVGKECRAGGDAEC